jgi:hypothetical protein
MSSTGELGMIFRERTGKEEGLERMVMGKGYGGPGRKSLDYRASRGFGR